MKSLYHLAAEAESDDESKKIVAHAKSSQSATRLKAMIELAKSEPTIAIMPDQLDQDPWLINVDNVTIDLRTGTACPHRRDDFITKIVPVRYDPAARCPTFLAFLNTIMANNTNLIDFLQRAAGYCLTGLTVERVIFILHGGGANGKSTLQEILRMLLGEFAMRVPTKMLMAKREDGVPNDLARLKGARFVSASETEEGRKLAESFIKDVTGTDTITARFMRAEWFDFRPEFKIFLATNHKPSIAGTDQAIWDRIRLVPFDIRIPDEQQDKHLLEKLSAELPGILNWAIEGCLEWQHTGLGTPEEVKNATQDYRHEMDTLGDWISDCCVVAAGTKTTAADLYKSYVEWSESQGEKTISQKMLGTKLKERGFESKSDGSTRWWQGIGLLGAVVQTDLTHASDLTHPDTDSDINRLFDTSRKVSRKTRQNVSEPPDASVDEEDDDAPTF